MIEELRANFAIALAEGESFEECISRVALTLNSLPNAANFQLVFDLLHWDWTATRESIHPEELDRICLKYSRFGESQEAEIASQKKAAQEWATALEASEMTPLQGIGLAKAEAQFIAAKTQRFSAIATHPSPLAPPQELTRLMRVFYRAERKYNPTTTNVLKPLDLATEAITQSGGETGEELTQLVLGKVAAFMRQVRAGTAKGRWVIPNSTDEIRAIYEFANFIVFHLLEEKWNGDKALFSSKKGIGLIRDTVSFLYLLEQDRENKAESPE